MYSWLTRNEEDKEKGGKNSEKEGGREKGKNERRKEKGRKEGRIDDEGLVKVTFPSLILEKQERERERKKERNKERGRGRRHCLRIIACVEEDSSRIVLEQERREK